MLVRSPFRRVAAILMAVPLAVMLLPALAAAHSELETSDPADGANVASPYTGPIVLTFSEHLASGTKADLVDPSGATVAASRSSIEPIVEWWYGCSGGNRWAWSFSWNEP